MIAYTFHFSPESLWSMSGDDISFWLTQAEKVQPHG